MTLRQLTWMAYGRCELQYDVAIATIQYFGASWNGDSEKSTRNPYRNVDIRKTKKQMKEEERDAWGTLRAGMKNMAG